ncbi:LysR family transcriptional regulator [Merdibacter massiliensis]|uniref:LysR substrate-binding domain-containing protein n=1 Tax=Merdibacter massiliensis TaxID=1871030 RepID=UPI00096A5087|nr:LysR family transcriptional regulator [Merdibacter massiliensis]
MDIKVFYYFQTVYEEQNIHTAAKKLYISPQGLGKIIKALEEEMGAALLTRTKKGVVATESGKIFYEKSKQFTKEIQEMKREIAMMNREKNELRIGFSAGTLKAISLQRIFDYQKLYPEQRIIWGENENEIVLRGIKEDTIDYGFVTSKIEDSLFQQMELIRLPILLLVYEGHPFWKENEVSMDMLQKEDMIVMNEQYHIYYDFMRSCQMHGFLPNICAKTMDGETLYHLCEQKVGLALCPAFPNPSFHHLKAIPFKENYQWKIYGTWKKRTKQRNCLMAFQSFCKDKL